MFYLNGRGGGGGTTAAAAAAKYDSPSSGEEENFGWWLSDREIVVSPRSHYVTDHRSLGSSASILSCVDSVDSDSCSFAQDVSRQEQESGISEKIELSLLARDDLDVDPIERDAGKINISSTTVNDNECNIREKSNLRPVCYTPERLIRSQEYRILIPSPRHFIFSQARFTSGNESGGCKSHRCQKRLNYLIDPKQIGATQLRELLNLPTKDVRTYTVSLPSFGRERYVANNCNTPMKSNNDFLLERHHGMQSTETISSSRSSYSKWNSTYDDCQDLAVRPSSFDNTSGIQSNDWSLETQSDARNTPMCLGDELAIASRVRTVSLLNNRSTAINEVASILESLQSEPEKATALLEEEDQVRNGTSSHDQLTRLALTIETDSEVLPTIRSTVPDDPNNLIHHLRDKIERLQLANKEIHKNICVLRTNFQCDEKKAINLSSDTTKLLEDIHDLRYFDDLLRLLEGELKMISKRNWPFILGHSKPHEEMNLII